MANQYTVLGRPAIADQKFVDIQNYIMDPDKFPLPAGLEDVFHRVVTAARLLDDYPEDRMVKKMLRAKYPSTSLAQLQKDVDLARELFKSQHTFDYDFWLQWRVKDVLDLLRRAKEYDNLKMWNEAHKTLIQLIGDKPEAIEDPRRMERNIIIIQYVNSEGKRVNVPIQDVRNQPKLLEEVVSNGNVTIDDEKADELFES